MPLVAECTSWWGITASLPPWLQEKHTWRALACTYVLTAIHHCNPVPHGTYGTTLCLSYLASLLSCVKIEECQMSGFSTEKLHLSSSEKFVPCSLQPYALSWGTQLYLLVQLGCIDCEWGGQPKNKVQSSVLVPTLDKLFQPSVATAAFVSLPRKSVPCPTRCC